MFKRIGQIFIIIALLEVCAGIFYLLIAIPEQDYFRVAIGLTHFAEALMFYLIGVYLTVYCSSGQLTKKIK